DRNAPRERPASARRRSRARIGGGYPSNLNTPAASRVAWNTFGASIEPRATQPTPPSSAAAPRCLPFELRARLAYDGKLLGAVCREFVDSVLGWYRRYFEARGLAGGKNGAVTVVQRVSSDLRLNPHCHTLCLDGVYVEDAHRNHTFH